MNQVAIINGIMFSWANISVVVLGNVVRGIRSIKYSYKQEKKNVYGFGTEPIGRTYGNVEYNCELVMLRDEVQNLLTAIKAAGYNKLTELAPFNIPVLYGQNPAGGLNPVPAGVAQDTVMSAEFLDFNMEAKQNDQELLMTLPMIIGGIKHV